MTPSEILAIANRTNIPKFRFDSAELMAWTQAHRDSVTGQAIKDSGFYVVEHHNADGLEFSVLSWWCWGQSVPFTWDVPMAAHEC